MSWNWRESPHPGAWWSEPVTQQGFSHLAGKYLWW
jgi:hypothetical protein